MSEIKTNNTKKHNITKAQSMDEGKKCFQIVLSMSNQSSLSRNVIRDKNYACFNNQSEWTISQDQKKINYMYYIKLINNSWR